MVLQISTLFSFPAFFIFQVFVFSCSYFCYFFTSSFKFLLFSLWVQSCCRWLCPPLVWHPLWFQKIVLHIHFQCIWLSFKTVSIMMQNRFHFTPTQTTPLSWAMSNSKRVVDGRWLSDVTIKTLRRQRRCRLAFWQVLHRLVVSMQCRRMSIWVYLGDTGRDLHFHRIWCIVLFIPNCTFASTSSVSVLGWKLRNLEERYLVQVFDAHYAY